MEDSLVPGIINKTILGIEAMQSRLDEFDYIIRTNLSSFFPFDNLKKYLNKLPRQNCYAGITLYGIKHLPQEVLFISFISGAGIILSRDLVKLLIKNHQDFDKYKAILPDDVFIGLFYQRKLVSPISAQRWDYPTYDGWVENHHKIEDYAYHFRAKSKYNIRTTTDPYADELLTLNALLKKYYPDAHFEEEEDKTNRIR